MEHMHFKIETLKAAIDAMRPNCFLGSVDLSEAFYSETIGFQDKNIFGLYSRIKTTNSHPFRWGYFRFIFKNQNYQLTSISMGLATSPRVFIKILKRYLHYLRSIGFISTTNIVCKVPLLKSVIITFSL